MARYLIRSVEPLLRRAAHEFPTVVLTGPRQSGKTTTLRRLFGRTHRYLSLDPPEAREAAVSDPRRFLGAPGDRIFLDEVQHVPSLLSYVKAAVDAEPRRKGRFVVTGSQSFALMQGLSESLAGRAAILRLSPMSWREAEGDPTRRLPWESGVRASAPGRPSTFAWRSVLRGGFPGLVAYPSRAVSVWMSSYVQTYLERDVRLLRQVGDLTQFQIFVRALAIRSAQLLDWTDLSRELGVAVNTVKAWAGVLEASDQILILRPYFENLGKRLVKTPKVYFTDTGLVAHLAGLTHAESLSRGPMAGPLFETCVVLEVWKTLLARGVEPRLYFWRTSDGREVDLVVESEGRLIPLEAKATSTPRPMHAAGIASFRSIYGRRAARGYVVHSGAVTGTLGPDADALPYVDL